MFGWELESFTTDSDLHKEVHGLDIKELRAQEKRMMQHNRTCAHQWQPAVAVCSGSL